VIAGGLLAMLASWLADRRLTARDRERRGEERRERLVTRRIDFQRETLLALQVSSQKLLRNTGAMHHEDAMALRTSGQWQQQSFTGDLSDDQLRHTTETMLLASRVRDEETRTLADELRKRTSGVFMSTNEGEAEARLTAASEIQDVLVQRIGQLIRDLDECD
jgi:hypothetical protein